MADQKLSSRAEISVPQDADLVHIVHNGTSYKIQYKNLVPEPPAAPDFHGTLAIADTPTLDGYYFASESGTYVNAGNLVVDLGTGLAIIIKKGGNYSILYHATGEDKVEFYNDYASFPVAGTPDVAYFDKALYKLYLWDQNLADYVLASGASATKRTIKTLANTTQYTLIAADFTDFILNFTANANEEISIILNAGVAPLDGELQMISTGNNKLVPSLTGVTATYPEQTNPKTILKGWLGGIVTATDTISFNGSLESTATSGDNYGSRPLKGITETSYTLVAGDETKYLTFTTDAPTTITIPDNLFGNYVTLLGNAAGEVTFVSGAGIMNVIPPTGYSPVIKKGGSFIVKANQTGVAGYLTGTFKDGGTTYAPFTNTVDGLVPAPNVGGTTYTVDITSPTEGATVTEGQVTSVTIDLPAGVVSTAEKFLKDDGWVDPIQILKYLVPLFSSGNETDTTLPSYAAFKEYYNRVFNFKGSTVGTWTLPNVADQFGVKIRVVNESNFTLTLNTNGGSAIIWNKNAMVNTIDLLAGETIEFECDATWYFITNKY